jgi:hypothetical protein
MASGNPDPRPRREPLRASRDGRAAIKITILALVAFRFILPGAEETVNNWQVHVPSGLPERFQAPPAIRWNYFRNHDGARIRYSHVTPGSAKAAVVLVPGYSEFGEKYFELMRDLVTQGYEVWQMDWRTFN